MADPQEQLDSLLTEYLHLLDRYTQLRAELSTHLASGFLALAHANRSAAQTLGAGRHYGEDAYDGRMRATRRVQIGSGPASFSTTASTIATTTSTTNTAGKVSSNTDEKHEQEQEQKQNNENENDENDENENEQNQPQTHNPLRWFGLLVPPALRQCQSHFTHSVAATIPELLTVMAKMKAAEDEIAKVRRELGLEDQDEDTTSQDTTIPHPTNASPPAPPSASSTSSTSSNHPLTTFVSRSRPSEPRPRVLTLNGASLS